MTVKGALRGEDDPREAREPGVADGGREIARDTPHTHCGSNRA